MSTTATTLWDKQLSRVSLIAEVRGIASNQNLDSEIVKTGILESKLKEFGVEGEKYKKRSRDMKRLTNIEKKVKNNEDLTREELRFLYQIDEKIEGFGYQRDPRINELLSARNKRKDLAHIFNLEEHRISLSSQEVLRGDIFYHYGDLDLSGLTSAKDLKLPEYVGGDLHLTNLTSAEGLKLPEHVGGNLHIWRLTSAEGLKLPGHVGGNLDISGLTSAQGVILPQYVGGDLHLWSLTSAEGLKLPEHVGAGLYLNGLTSTEGLKLPEHVGRFLQVNKKIKSQIEALPLVINKKITIDYSDY